MTLEEIIREFGGVAHTARALGVTRQTIYYWRRKGEMPALRIMQSEVLIRERKQAGE